MYGWMDEIAHFCTFQTSLTLTLDRVMAYRRMSVIDPCVHTKFRSNQKLFVDGQKGGRMYTNIGFIRLTWKLFIYNECHESDFWD